MAVEDVRPSVDPAIASDPTTSGVARHRPPTAAPDVEDHSVGAALVALLDVASASTSDLASIVGAVGSILGARSARLLVADYSLNSLRYLANEIEDGHGVPPAMEGTLAGRAFSRGETLVSGDRVCVPVSENSERIGVLEMDHPAWEEVPEDLIDPVVRILTLILVSKRRYTDAMLRTRRTEELSLAAEMQWGLLPPLSCTTPKVSVSGILEPAYSIGGDSFDFAFNADMVEFGIIDAVGHGMSAVLISTVAINGLRNARREGRGLESAYADTGRAIASQFGDDAFVTGQIGSLDLPSGNLSWLNAGHPLPLLIRNGAYADELSCRPSIPMGLGGTVKEVAVEHLQAGDCVLFYTDGVTETRSADGDQFGVPRLVDFLVRAVNDGLAPVETLRSLSAAILAYSGTGLSDDATLVMIEYHGP
ncbi:PP2C family protein-serine/threonine phosphatase [Dermatobacter hominis]|uniref:PP2C family protein-serine/threonine phosphatase n=1 Tax=Dermatobacter hominis TaxID=2884263 RepID=UPI001D1232DA|nr:PP2C family protein-serine/threonine phosphatase [Dermatobacter hominis]UDY37629.1 serine/threonine-protein phosphatase [Dermatobacter hominis]